MTSDRKTEPPLKLDMGFGEALERFVGVKPKEVAESVERSKTKKPPGVGDLRRQERPSERDGSPLGRKRKPSGD